MSPTLAAILAKSSRNAIVEIAVQMPNPFNSTQASSQIILDGVKSLTITKNEEPTSDTIDFEISNPDGRYSPLQSPGNLGP